MCSSDLFYTMADWVEKLFSRLEKLESAGENALEGQGSTHGDDGGDPPPPFAKEFPHLLLTIIIGIQEMHLRNLSLN